MEDIKDLIKEYCDCEGFEYREDYSGRGMYGKSCIAIVCDNPLNTICSLFAFIVDSDYELSGFDVQSALGKPKQDSMGMRDILYFPMLET